jgi:hypothetical protein
MRTSIEFLLYTFVALCTLVSLTFSAGASVIVNLQTNWVGGWTFTGNADDSSANANHATISGGELTFDRFGNANSALTITTHMGNATTLQNMPLVGNVSRTVSYWTRFTTQGYPGFFPGTYTQSFISWGDESDLGSMFLVAQESTGNIYFRGLVADLYYSPANSLPPFDEWRMITFTYDGSLSSAAAYINGVIQTNVILGIYNPVGFDGPLATVSTPLTMYGAQGDFIDDVFIYNKALSSEEVTALFQAQSAAVPEPSTFLTGTLLLGAALLSVLKRRKR